MKKFIFAAMLAFSGILMALPSAVNAGTDLSPGNIEMVSADNQVSDFTIVQSVNVGDYITVNNNCSDTSYFVYDESKTTVYEQPDNSATIPDRKREINSLFTHVNYKTGIGLNSLNHNELSLKQNFKEIFIVIGSNYVWHI